MPGSERATRRSQAVQHDSSRNPPPCGVRMLNYDPLIVVNPKVPCSHCQRNPNPVQKGVECPVCFGTGFKPVDLCGLWSPSAAFLVCGGPSLNKLPFHRLNERGIVSMGVNNVAGYVKTSAWTFGDPQNKFHHGLFLDPKVMTFAPFGKLKRRVRAKFPDGTFRTLNRRVRSCPGTFGFSRRTVFDAKTFLTTKHAHWGRGGKQDEADLPFRCLCTMLLGIRLLHYLGCPRVYMLGVDFQMTEAEQYSFGQTAGVRNGRYAKENAMLAELKPHFEKEGFQLFNCNPDSGCDVFPKVTFEQAFEDCRGGVPNEPFDLKDWYGKNLAEEQEKLFPDIVGVDQLVAAQKAAGRMT